VVVADMVLIEVFLINLPQAIKAWGFVCSHLCQKEGKVRRFCGEMAWDFWLTSILVGVQ
jgi:hypothetical protein